MEFLTPGRTTRPADDPIFALNAEASQRRARGESIVNATVGALLNDDGTLAILPSVVEAFRAVPPEQAAAYAPLAGPASFHEAVLDELFGLSPLRPHAVAVATPGGTGALRHALCSYLEPGQSMLTGSLYWGPYKTIADENDRKVDTFALFDDKLAFNVPALEAKLDFHLATQGRALIFLNDPCQNPTGYSMSADAWREVAAVLLQASQRGPITLLVDVAYYLYSDNDPRAFLQYLEPLVGEVGLLFAWSGSKSFCQYGARIGAIVVVDPNMARRKRSFDALAFACRGTWSNCNHAGMLAVTSILRDSTRKAQTDGEREVLRAILRGRVSEFNARAVGTSLRYPRYEGGFFSTVLVPEGKSPQTAAAHLRESGIFVVPQGQGLRVALCSVAVKDVPRLVTGLAEVAGNTD